MASPQPFWAPEATREYCAQGGTDSHSKLAATLFVRRTAGFTASICPRPLGHEHVLETNSHQSPTSAGEKSPEINTCRSTARAEQPHRRAELERKERDTVAKVYTQYLSAHGGALGIIPAPQERTTTGH